LELLRHPRLLTNPPSTHLSRAEYIEDNIRHVLKNVKVSERVTGRRFSWSHSVPSEKLELVRKKFEEASAT